MAEKLLITHGTVLTLGEKNEVIENGAVLLQDRKIAAVGPSDDLEAAHGDATKVDAHGGVIMPGMLCTHMHLYSTFARGMDMKAEAPSNFQEILDRLWWRLDKALTPKANMYSALVPLVQCLRHGTTSILDHHASPNAVTGSLEILAEAAHRTGVRACLCYEVSDRDGPEIARAGIKENVDFLKKAGEGDLSLISATFGAHASFTVGDETLEECIAGAREAGMGLHIHCAEGPGDLQDARSKYGSGVIERLHRRGALGPKTLAIHCIHISDEEMDILAETGTNVIHNPESNMGNAVGCSPILKMMEKGVRVGLGTDGFTTSMFHELKVANILHKHQAGDPRVAYGEVWDMVTKNNPAITSEFLHGKFGVLEEGAVADVITLDYDPPTPMHQGNVLGHLIFGMDDGNVRNTIIDGKVRMKDRELVDLDEAEIMAKAREVAADLWERF